MPSIEYTCHHCGHTFKRVIFQGDKPHKRPCPKCGNEVNPDKSFGNLFEGNLAFSSLGKDTN